MKTEKFNACPACSKPFEKDKGAASKTWCEGLIICAGCVKLEAEDIKADSDELLTNLVERATLRLC